MDETKNNKPCFRCWHPKEEHLEYGGACAGRFEWGRCYCDSFLSAPKERKPKKKKRTENELLSEYARLHS